MCIKTVLNRCHPIGCFVYGTVRFVGQQVRVEIRPRKGSRPVCSGCGLPGPTYDTARVVRFFEFVPLWGFVVFLCYAMRRVGCAGCGVTVERVPWAQGKQQTCDAYRVFLARWARRISWSEVGEVFQTNWGVVYRAVKWVVAYGLGARNLDGIRAIGVDVPPKAGLRPDAVWRGTSTSLSSTRSTTAHGGFCGLDANGPGRPCAASSRCSVRREPRR